MLKYYLNFIMAVLLFGFCDNSADRIAGGTQAQKGQFPFFVQIKTSYNSSISFICGASLVHASWILTAAHCLPNTTEKREELTSKGFITAYMGTNLRYDLDAYTEKVAQIFSHPKFVRVMDHEGRTKKCQYDIAVAKLKNPSNLSKYIAPILLPSKTTPMCNVGVIVGTGRIVFEPRQYDKYVQYVKVHPKTRKELSNQQRPFAETVFYAEVQFMAGHDLKGDSGGPFVCYFENNIAVQFGSMSRSSFTAGNRTYISVLESIRKHLDFILEYVPVQVYERQRWRVTEIEDKKSSSDSNKRTVVFLLVFVCLSWLCF